MLDPLLVRVDGAAVLAGSLAVSLGDGGGGVDGRTHVEGGCGAGEGGGGRRPRDDRDGG